MPDEPTSSAGESDADLGYTSSGVPTFESIREKIEKRYTTSIGAAELDAESIEGRAIEEQYQARQQAAAERLAQIRESMRDDTCPPAEDLRP
jgi:phage shock protein A